MIEPCVSTKQCVCCGDPKPLSEFSLVRRARGMVPHSYCKACRNLQAMERKRRLAEAKGQLPRLLRRRTPGLYPRPPMEGALDQRCSGWRGPVNKGVLRWVA